jgi:hypothetical protein
VFNTHSDPHLLAAFWTGVGALLLTLALGAQIVILRVSLRRRERRARMVVASWRPILSAAAVGNVPEHLPHLASQDRLTFMKLWVHLHASLRGHASAGLNTIAMRLHCDSFCRTLLEQGRHEESLLATFVLGYMQDRQSQTALQRRIRSKDGIASLHAAWALMLIDPEQAAPDVVALAISRQDWVFSQVVAILRDGGRPCMQALIGQIAELAPYALPKALRIAEGIQATLDDDLHERLMRHASTEIVAMALRLAATSRLLPLVRELAVHTDWNVRVQAAKALGRIGEREDIDILMRLLSDNQWWVRYRAAQALASLPYVNRADLDVLVDRLEDRYGRDMMRQVIAEKVSA